MDRHRHQTLANKKLDVRAFLRVISIQLIREVTCAKTRDESEECKKESVIVGELLVLVSESGLVVEWVEVAHIVEADKTEHGRNY